MSDRLVRSKKDAKKHAEYFISVFLNGLQTPGFYSGFIYADSCKVPDALPPIPDTTSKPSETERNPGS